MVFMRMVMTGPMSVGIVAAGPMVIFFVRSPSFCTNVFMFLGGDGARAGRTLALDSKRGPRAFHAESDRLRSPRRGHLPPIYQNGALDPGLDGSGLSGKFTDAQASFLGAREADVAASWMLPPSRRDDAAEGQ